MRFGQCAVGPSSITRLKDVSSPSVWRALHSLSVKFTQCSAEQLRLSDFSYINILMPTHILCISTLHSRVLHVFPLCENEMK